MTQNRIPLKSYHYSPQGKRTIGRPKNIGESSCNSGDGPGQMAQPLMFMIMMMITPWIPSFLASQEMPGILWNASVHCRFHNSLTLVPILSQFNPYHTSQLNSVRFVIILSSYLGLSPTSGLFSSVSPTKSTYALLLSPMRATIPAHLTLLDLVTLMLWHTQKLP
jgi:hypothetical protein